MDREGSLDSDAAGDLAERDCLCDATVLDGDAGSLKKLNSLFVPFADLYVNLDGVTRPDVWNVGLDVSRDHALQNCLFRHVLFYFCIRFVPSRGTMPSSMNLAVLTSRGATEVPRLDGIYSMARFRARRLALDTALESALDFRPVFGHDCEPRGIAEFGPGGEAVLLENALGLGAELEYRGFAVFVAVVGFKGDFDAAEGFEGVGKDEEFCFGVQLGSSFGFDIPGHPDFDLEVNFADVEVVGHPQDLTGLEVFDDLTVDARGVEDVVDERLPAFGVLAGRDAGDVVFEGFEAGEAGEVCSVLR